MYNKKSLKEILAESSLGHLAGNGEIRKLEERLCKLYNTKHALVIDSATNAILYLFLALGIKRSEVLSPSLTYGGTIVGPMLLGCKFHFAAVNNFLTIDTESISKIISNNPTVKAVIATEFCGNTFDYKRVSKICRDKGIVLIVDSAQSLGFDYKNESITSYSDAVVVSTGTGKVLDIGSGGAILTNSQSLYKQLILTCQHAHRQEVDVGIGKSTEFSLNGRMNPILAAIANNEFNEALVQLKLKRERLTDVIHCLQKFESVDKVLVQVNGTFYYFPVRVKNNQLGEFEKEFDNSSLGNDYYWSTANFVSIPEQLRRAGRERRILTYDKDQVDAALNNLILIHTKDSVYE